MQASPLESGSIVTDTEKRKFWRQEVPWPQGTNPRTQAPGPDLAQPATPPQDAPRCAKGLASAHTLGAPPSCSPLPSGRGDAGRRRSPRATSAAARAAACGVEAAAPPPRPAPAWLGAATREPLAEPSRRGKSTLSAERSPEPAGGWAAAPPAPSSGHVVRAGRWGTQGEPRVLGTSPR